MKYRIRPFIFLITICIYLYFAEKNGWFKLETGDIPFLLWESGRAVQVIYILVLVKNMILKMPIKNQKLTEQFEIAKGNCSEIKNPII